MDVDRNENQETQQLKHREKNVTKSMIELEPGARTEEGEEGEKKKTLADFR